MKKMVFAALVALMAAPFIVACAEKKEATPADAVKAAASAVEAAAPAVKAAASAVAK